MPAAFRLAVLKIPIQRCEPALLFTSSNPVLDSKMLMCLLTQGIVCETAKGIEYAISCYGICILEGAACCIEADESRRCDSQVHALLVCSL
jgi:hypothetical protein